MMKDFKKVISFAKPYRWQIIFAMTMLALVVAADLALPRLIQKLIDEGVAVGNLTVVWRQSAIIVGISFLAAIFSFLNTVFSVRSSYFFGRDLRLALFKKAQKLSFANFDNWDLSKILVRLTADVESLQQTLRMTMRIILRSPLMVVGSSIMLLGTSLELSLIVLFLLPVLGILIGVFLFKVRPLFRQVQKKLEALNRVLVENLNGARVVKAFGGEKREISRFFLANQDFARQNIQVMQIFAILAPTLLLVINFGGMAVVWLGGQKVIAGVFSSGQLVAFLNYLFLTIFPLVMLGMVIARLAAARVSAQRVGEIFSLSPQVKEKRNALTLGKIKGEIIFDEVEFRYQKGAPAVLRQVNLKIKPGERVAILGATGAGKSTLIYLIPRFYDPTAGRVLIDGVNLRRASLPSLRSQIGVCFQQPLLFSGTVEDNIKYGSKDISDERMIEAAKIAQIHHFIMNLPQGYQTPVLQGGANFSGGQKQRLALARALALRPKILLLDDATSALDAQTEIKVQQNLRKLAQRKESTILMVAQRVSSVLSFDRIVILDSGVISAVGTHQELLEKSQIYQEIYQSQLGESLLL
ncbi:ABC transporter ATP-binding protein [Candidatus Shapirobacteria bacterium]|nr:ABC transporter ATP-binding protein [Candidatus Shapirobacteria bacterium]